MSFGKVGLQGCETSELNTSGAAIKGDKPRVMNVYTIFNDYPICPSDSEDESMEWGCAKQVVKCAVNPNFAFN